MSFNFVPLIRKCAHNVDGFLCAPIEPISGSYGIWDNRLLPVRLFSVDGSKYHYYVVHSLVGWMGSVYPLSRNSSYR